MQIRVCSKERNQGNEWSSFFFSVLRCLARSKLQHSFTRATHFISNLFFYQFVIPLLLPPFPTPFKISFTYSSRGVSSLKIKQRSYPRIDVLIFKPVDRLCLRPREDYAQCGRKIYIRCDPSCQRRPSSTRLSNASVCKFPHRLRSSDRSIGKGDLKKKKVRRKRGRLSIFIHVPTIDPRRLANAITSQASIVIKADGDEKGEDVPPASDRPPRLNFSREKRAVAKSVRGGKRERERLTS